MTDVTNPHEALKRASRIWGEDCSVQLYGGGGRIVGEGETIRFASFDDLIRIMDARANLASEIADEVAYQELVVRVDPSRKAKRAPSKGA